MKNRGKTFEKELKASIEHAGVRIDRIPDRTYWNGNRVASEESPADFYAFSAGKDMSCIIIEAKASSSGRVEFSRLKQHQKDALQSFSDMHKNAHGFIAINFYDKVSIRRMNRLFMIPVDEWVNAERDGLKKSINIAQCEENPAIIECDRAKGSMYDMARWASIFR